MENKKDYFPPSVQDFFVIQHVPLNALVSSYLDLDHNLSPFCIFLIYFADWILNLKGSHCEILNLNL